MGNDIESLCGSHNLTGVDISLVDLPDTDRGDSLQDCTVCRIELDGKIYEFRENPNDGYRSYHEGPFIVSGEIKNKFEAVHVVCQYKNKNEFRTTADILLVINVQSGAEILEVGTENSDDYYPFFVCNFSAASLGMVGN